MDITANQLLLAFDEYMKNNGGGSNYLKSKFRKIFDNKDAPLNGETGPLVKLAEASRTFAKKLADLSSKMEKPLGKFKDSLTKTVGTFDDLSKYVNSLKITTAISPLQETDEAPLDMGKFMMDMRKMIRETESPMIITGISAAVLATISGLFSKKEEILPSRDEKVGIVDAATKSFSRSSDERPDMRSISVKEEKGSLLGSILKWAGLIFAGSYLLDFLNKSPVGRDIIKIVKDGITSVFKWAGEVLTSPKTKENVINAVSFLWRGLKFLGNAIYDNIIGPVWEKIKSENLGLSKFTLGGVLKIIPKIFRTTSAVLKGITNAAKMVFPKLAKVLRFIPGIGTIISLFYAYDRFKKGDFVGGVLEVAAGVAYFFPGIGTAIGIGIDVLNTFLDYKQSQPENKGKGKGNIISDLLGSAKAWLLQKFGEEQVLKLPILGPLMKIGKGWDLMKSSPGEGIKQILKGIWALNPISSLANAISFIDFVWSDDAKKDPTKGSAASWFSDTWIETIDSWVHGIVDSIIDGGGWLFGKMKDAIDWIFGKSEEELSDMDKLKRDNPKEYRKRKLDEYRASVTAQSNKINVVPINDGKADGRGITVIKPDAKDHHLFAKDGGPFDVFLKQMNANFDEKLTTLVALSIDTINAIVQSGGQISKTIVATAGSSNQSSQTPTYSNADPVRDFRNRANMIIGR